LLAEQQIGGGGVIDICIILGGQGIAKCVSPWPMGSLKDGRKKREKRRGTKIDQKWERRKTKVEIIIYIYIYIYIKERRRNM
jgi:hypothetical protein